MTNQTTTLEHYDARECALAGRDLTDPSACKACVAAATTSPTTSGNARAAALLAARGAVVSFPKTMLTARKRGQGGSIVTVRAGSWSARYGVGPFVVKDLFDRSKFNDPLQIGVGPLDRGVAWGILLSDIVNVRAAS